MDQETADVLATHLQAQAFERRPDDYSDHGLVLCTPDGTPPDPDSASQRFEAFVAPCAQLKAIPLHDCRHTHATLLLEAGESMDYVADRLGDRIDTVARVYAHLTHRRYTDAVARWAGLKLGAAGELSEIGDPAGQI